MSYPFKLQDLPYPKDALEPHIDAQTMEIHHGRHHQTYTNNLNAALEKHTDLHGRSIDELLRGIDSLPEDIRTAVRNNGGGYDNHNLFWAIMSPKGGGEPGGELGSAIKSKFGSFQDFKQKLTSGRHRPVRQRLGLARRGGRRARRVRHAEPGQPAHEGTCSDPRRRCLGARVLPEVPEQAPRLRAGLVERGELGRGRTPLQRGARLTPCTHDRIRAWTAADARRAAAHALGLPHCSVTARVVSLRAHE
jgi:hypothetical protein